MAFLAFDLISWESLYALLTLVGGGVWIAYFIGIWKQKEMPAWRRVLIALLVPIGLPATFIGVLVAVVVVGPIFLAIALPRGWIERRRYARLVAKGRALDRRASEEKFRAGQGTLLIVFSAVGIALEVRWTPDRLPGLPLELLESFDRERILSNPEKIDRNRELQERYLRDGESRATIVALDPMEVLFGEGAENRRTEVIIVEGRLGDDP